MKINGTGQLGSASGVSRKKAARTGGSSFESALDIGETHHGGSVGGAAPLSPVGALLALQETPDATVGRSKGVARAEDMLKQLEDLRRGLLLGAISPAKLEKLAETVRRQRQAVDDPRLNDILDEIELRVEVELAKLGYAG